MFVIDVGGAHLEESPQTLKEAGHIISTKITAKKRARAEGAGAGGLGATGKRKSTATEKGKAKETGLPEKDKGKEKCNSSRFTNAPFLIARAMFLTPCTLKLLL